MIRHFVPNKPAVPFATPLARASIAVASLALGFVGASVTAASAADASNATVAFLMPDQSSTRYEEHDHPGFVAEMKKLCPDLQGALSERRRRRLAPAAAIQLGR